MKVSITISREYGSGGREIGKIIANKLGYNFYDSKLVDLAVEKGILSKEQAKEADERPLNPWLYAPLYVGSYFNSYSYSEPERLFKVQSDIIKEKALSENCVFVGRAADFVLRDEDIKLINIFICAPKKWRVNRLMNTEGFSDKQAAYSAVSKVDRQRKNYYNYYTGREYNDPVNYDLCINSSVLGIEKTASYLISYIDDILKDNIN